MIKPKEVNPSNFTVEKIIYGEDDVFSIAIGIWHEDESRRWAMRWNGNEKDPDDLGYPKAFGHPMWFQLPYDFKEILLKALLKEEEKIKLIV